MILDAGLRGERPINPQILWKDVFLDRVLPCSLPQFQITDCVRQANSEDPSKAGVVECLDSLRGVGFTTELNSRS